MDSHHVNNLQLLFANFGLVNNGRVELESNGASTSLRVDPTYGHSSAPRTQQEREEASLVNFNQNQQSCLGFPTPPYPQSTRLDPGSSPASNSNLLYTSSVPFSPLNYMNNRQYNYVMEQATTPDGSQNLQSLLSRGDPRIVDQIFDGVIGSIFRLMTNRHGCYVFWKLIPLLGRNQMLMITQKLSQQNGKPIIDASFQPDGSHSLQRLMKLMIRWDMVAPMVAALSNEFCGLMKDKTARNVVVKCVELAQPSQSELLYRAGIDSCIELARDMTGYISLNQFIEHVKGPLRDQLLHKISDYSIFLAQDPFANYVLQKVLDLRNPMITEKICRLLRGEYANLSMQKAGSYVVEKCLNYSEWTYAVDDLLKSESDQLLQIAKSQFGNYVVQAALRVTKEQSPYDRHPKLLEKLKSNLFFLQSGHGKNVLHEIAKSKDEHRSC